MSPMAEIRRLGAFAWVSVLAMVASQVCFVDRRRSVFEVVEDAFPARFDGREQPLRPYRCSNAASEADNEYRHPFSLASYLGSASATCMRWHYQKRSITRAR